MKRSDIAAFLAPYRHRPLFLGFSGGVDSSCLLLLLLELEFSFTAVHFEHGLRGEASEADADAARKLCAQLDVPFRLIRLDVPARRRQGEGIEAAARRCRLSAWRRLLRDAPPDAAVLLAHQADDRRENLLLRLARGGNASGLTGLRRISRACGFLILRPLLPCSRPELESYLADRNFTGIRHDRSNEDAAFRRNFLRRELLPDWFAAMPHAAAGLDRALAALEEEARFLETLAAGQLKKIADETRTPAAFWRQLPPPLQIRVLRGYLAGVLKRDFIPNRALLLRFRRLLAAPADGKTRQLRLEAGIQLLRRGEVVILAPSPSFPPSPVPTVSPVCWRWAAGPVACGTWRFRAEETAEVERGGDLFRACFDAALLPTELRLEPARPGDRLIPFGRTEAEKLKKLRVDRKIPADAALPVVKTPDGVIIWAPGIRHGNYAAVTAATRQIATLRCSPLTPEA